MRAITPSVIYPLPLTVPGLTALQDGHYNIYINENLSEAAQREALEHELRHVEGGDFEPEKPLEAVELYAAAKKETPLEPRKIKPIPVAGYLEDSKYGRIPVLDVKWAKEEPLCPPPPQTPPPPRWLRNWRGIDIYATHEDVYGSNPAPAISR